MPKGQNVLECKEFYRRALPHWQPPGATIFLTYRLVDSLPKHVLERIKSEYEHWLQELKAADTLTAETLWLLNKKKIIAIDDALDFEKSGPHWLADPQLADLIVDNLHHHAEGLYHLWAYVVMSNHVHAQLEPLPVTPSAGLGYVSLARITHALKSYTSKKANEILNREGRFWQIESYDHWIRNEKEFARVVAYIENNPVKAGLCQEPQKWKWSSAHKRKELGLDYSGPLPHL